jgi:hypothetical protein
MKYKQDDILINTLDYRVDEVRYYQVWKVTPKSVYLREIASYRKPTDSFYYNLLPLPFNFLEPPFIKRIPKDGGWIKLRKHFYLKPWKGGYRETTLSL